jgi:hypothetical protein
MTPRSPKKKACRLMGLTGLREWLAERGVERSRKELQRRAALGQFGQFVDSRYIITGEEAQELLESLRPQDS